VISPASHVPLSPVGFLQRARHVYPSKAAVIEADGSVVTYEQLARNADAIAGALRGSGATTGERFAILDYNSPWLAAAHFGVPGAGGVLVALNTRLAAAEYRAILAHAAARVLLVAPGLVKALGVESAADVPVEQVVLLPGPDPVDLPGAIPLREWLGRGDGTTMALPSNENDMIAVNYTSGRTGAPKGVVYTHRGAYLNALSVALEFELSPSSRYTY
jgi:fatty-acyl-CoA synthase